MFQYEEMENEMRKFRNIIWILVVCMGLFCGNFVYGSYVKIKKNKSEEWEIWITNINKKHESIEKIIVNYDEYLPLNLNGKVGLEWKKTNHITDESLMTFDEMENDINYLLYHLQTQYGLYNFLGGNERFQEAKEKILNACEVIETKSKFEDKILEEFCFVQDKHFTINAKNVIPEYKMFFFGDTAFKKEGESYINLEKKLIVNSVKNYKDLDELFRMGISKDGKIVYYPIVIALEMPENLEVLYENN
ncbi:MAG: hypothetical protein Q4D90_05215, partial [bacterium]|nr:hypothetical protein [bacterium]